MLVVTKNIMPPRTNESVWFHILVFRLCPKVNFPCRKVFIWKVIFTLMKQTLIAYVQFSLAKFLSTTCTFNLWMLKGAHNVFAMIVNFLSTNCEPKDVIIGLFKTHDMNETTMAMKLKEIFNKLGLTQKIVAYIKDNW